MRPADIAHNILRIRIDALNSFPLFRYHVCELCEDLAKLRYRRFNGFNGGRPLLDVRILLQWSILSTAAPRRTYLLLDLLHLFVHAVRLQK